MLFALLYTKRFSRDDHFKCLFLGLALSITAFLRSLVINLTWFCLSFVVFKGACSSNTLRKIDVHLSYCCSSFYELRLTNS